jgi:hypothetical protein
MAGGSKPEDRAEGFFFKTADSEFGPGLSVSPSSYFEAARAALSIRDFPQDTTCSPTAPCCGVAAVVYAAHHGSSDDRL